MPSKCIEKRRKPKWDKDSVKNAAAGCTSRSEFAEKNKPAYEAARLLGILHELFDLKLHQWDEQSIRNEAAKYTSRTEFANKSGAAYNAARRLCILSTLFPSKLKTWDEDAVRKESIGCLNKKDLKRKCATAYNAALRLGIIDDLFENQKKINTRDCVYLWSVDGEPGLYKVGITSADIGMYRVHQVAKEAGVTPILIFLHRVGYDAAKIIEREMKKLGTKYTFPKKFYGHSEFRYLTPEEVAKCVRLALQKGN